MLNFNNNLCLSNLAINDGEQQISYKEVIQLTSVVRKKMGYQKLKTNETIGLIVDQSVSSIVVLLGLFGMDSNVLLLDTSQPDNELERIGRLCNVRIWITKEDKSFNLPIDHTSVLLRYGDVIDSSLNDDQDHCSIPVSKNSLILLPSSGSTGRLKVVRIPKPMLLAEGKKFSNWFGLQSDDVVLATVPLNYMYGLSAPLLGSLYSGSSLHICKNPSPRKVVKYIRSYGCTAIFAIPQMYYLLNESDMVKTYDLQPLRLVITAGDKLEPQVASQFQNKFCKRILQIYGSTETGCIAAHQPNVKSLKNAVGKVMTGVNVTVSKNNKIIVKSKTLFLGYMTEEGIVNPVINHTFETNDLGEVREDQVFLFGRYSPHFKVGARLIDPNEIVSAIKGYPGVENIQVNGEPDLVYGQKIVAKVIANHHISEQQIKAFLSSKLASYKIPHTIIVSDQINSWKKTYINVEEEQKHEKT
jgi:long-chain acyl-CoA synthetase